MSVDTARTGAGAVAGPPAVSPVRRRFGRLAAATALYTYALIVFGGIVRITGSGMGCGDDWPLCNGRLVPPLELEPLIEWGHRLLAAGMVVPFAALVLLAVRHRAAPGFAGRGGILRPTGLAVGLLVIQVLLGAVTVKLELSAGVTALHFVTAASILAALLVAAIRAGTLGGQATEGGAAVAAGDATPARRRHGHDARSLRRFAGAATGAAALGLLVVAFGALTANTGAAPACQGFPLCNGRWLPHGPSLVHIHWTHRLFAYLLFFHVVAATVAAWRRRAPRPVLAAAAAAAALVIAQVVVAVGLIHMHLPESLQVVHLVIGTALWGALVVWATLARRCAATA